MSPRAEVPRARQGTGPRPAWTFRPTPDVEDAVHAWALRHGHNPAGPGVRTSALVDLIAAGHAALTAPPADPPVAAWLVFDANDEDPPGTVIASFRTEAEARRYIDGPGDGHCWLLVPAPTPA